MSYTTSSSYLALTPSVGNRRLFTISFWLKRSGLDNNQIVVMGGATGFWIMLHSTNALYIRDYQSSAYQISLRTYRQFEDCTSWYHIVVAVDTAQATDTDRVKLYVNGVQETAFDVDTYPDQNHDTVWNTAVSHEIGRESGVSGDYFSGNLAHFANVDGTACAPTVFGETDSTTGEWKPILAPSVTWGDEGWWLKFENSGALGTDSSGNSNTFTVNGSVKQSISTPSNNFCTLDTNQSYSEYTTYAGTAILGTSTNARGANSTLMIKDGKWYAEFKVETDRTTSNGTTIGIYKNGTYASRVWINEGSTAIPGNETGSNGCEGVSYQPMTSTPNIIDAGGGGTVNYGSTASAGDIIMMAVDLSAATSKIWFGKNGTWFNAPGTSDVGVPNTGAYPGLSFAKGDDFWGVNVTAVCNAAGDTNKTLWCNFGEGRFGTTAVSSGNADDNGVGVFEYDVPAGFYAICTKNIKTYG